MSLGEGGSRLLAVVEVDREDRVVCQAPGCGHGVYKRIHVVRIAGGIGIYGSDCFGRLFGGNESMQKPSFGSGDGRRLTQEERAMLVSNTAGLIAQFEAEIQACCRRPKTEPLLRVVPTQN